MLTAKQRELLLYIHERIKESGVSPSFDEMKEALDLASKSGIYTHDDILRLRNAGARGFLVGESLMRQDDVEAATRTLLGR